jgi:hypothetical protein
VMTRVPPGRSMVARPAMIQRRSWTWW